MRAGLALREGGGGGRRGPPPPPPGPAPPRAGARRGPPPRPFAIGEWHATWDEEAYAAAIEAVQAAIARGDVYQVNLVQHLSASFAGDPRRPASALALLRPLHPPPPLRA